jgi:hypothetical protein
MVLKHRAMCGNTTEKNKMHLMRWDMWSLIVSVWWVHTTEILAYDLVVYEFGCSVT